MNQVMTNPVDEKQTTTFLSEAKANTLAEPTLAIATGTFKMGLFSNGVQLGWMGKDSSGWAVLVTDPNQAVQLELYPYSGVNYYRIANTSSYMSVSNSAYIGFYNWLGATGFTRNSSNLVSDYNQQKLSLYSKDNGYLYAWDAYTVLDVKFIE